MGFWDNELGFFEDKRGKIDWEKKGRELSVIHPADEKATS